MTLHPRDTGPANEVAPQEAPPEAFAEVAHAELARAPLHVAGVCYLPECSRAFTPRRPWQRYCSPACKRAGLQEARTWGLRMAEAMLCHRLGKYERHDGAVMERTRAARRHVARVQSAWLRDREARKRAAEERNAE